jgi:hypothetical protein
MGYRLRVTGYDLQVAGCKLRVVCPSIHILGSIRPKTEATSNVQPVTYNLQRVTRTPYARSSANLVLNSSSSRTQ